MFCVKWRGPISLSVSSLQSLVPTASPAVAILGELDSSGELIIRRLVRSDTDICADLQPYVGRYSHCKLMPCTSPAQAYVIECELYHRLHPSDSEAHPGEPGGLNVVCPFCGFRMKPKIVA